MLLVFRECLEGRISYRFGFTADKWLSIY